MGEATAAAPAATLDGLHGAFMQEGFGPAQTARLAAVHGTAPGTSGALAGQRLAVKDVYEVAGLRVGAGQPQWHAEQPEARESAIAVGALLDAGAEWVGKTVTDELTYSLAGINAHYGKPVNPAVPERLSGGSSSGSAVAVAAGHADIALGTDCGGSIRLPASYCGIWGMRPTHGRVAANGCFTLAHSFDTVAWFAREGALMITLLEELARTRVEGRGLVRLLVAQDAVALLDAPVRDAFLTLCEAGLPGFAVETLPAGALALADWAAAFRTLQAAEIWQQHGRWVTQRQPQLGADIAQRFDAASRIGREAVAPAQAVRVAASTTLAQVLGTDALLLWPTVPTVAPRNDAPLDHVNEIRARSQQLLSPAGLAGLPQVSLPWRRFDGAPLGLSLLGARGADEAVLATARTLADAIGAPAG